MIGYLAGKPEVLSDTVLVHTGAVAYEVWVGQRLLQVLTTRDQVELYIYTHVREDALSLFGFLSLQERSLFTELLAISGVGPKTALAIVDHGVSELVTAVQQADIKFFSKVPRVGKKSAQKIIIELKSKLGGLTELDLTPLSSFESDVVAALESLGFSSEDAQETVKRLDFTESTTVQQALQQAMKLLAK